MEAVITPQQALDGEWTVVDVRSAGERAAVRVGGSQHAPLEEVKVRVRALQAAPQAQRGETLPRVALLCKSGMRARMAQERLAACGVAAAVVAGGMDRWRADGLPVVRGTASTWSLERQVRCGAGALVMAGTLLAAVVNPHWLWLTGFAGAGLAFAGVTDICMMGTLLAKMPWNRVRS
jgi:rhodanese-related sulfurtransferase